MSTSRVRADSFDIMFSKGNLDLITPNSNSQ